MTGQYASARGRSGTNGFAVAGLACGVVGLIVAAFILGPLAIIFGFVGRKNAGANGSSGMATAAIVLGVVDIVLVIILMATGGGGFFIGS
ncbi:DUF4190 domain-containing protein [Streptomyces indicus]|uniref:DUF4190 domain-containing protein n=1 Tax=Streptomyces indicus TaxID=417292 RepID=A0A1G9CDJ0_9ACTN|nr:DUF4190 domain-containing protein [Streptomyces indicus]SDK49730.1 protein of unknown function [Streptomyces indicus]